MSSVEQLCEAFDAAWKAGERPLIEVYARGVPAANRLALFRELLRIELGYRTRENERPRPQEYAARFPDHESVIETIFREMGTLITPAGSTPATILRATEAAAGTVAGLPAIPGYEILETLTPGGMGVVYRARQIETDRPVVLKMIRSGIHAAAEDLARFRIEAEAIASLAHPNIIQIHECGEWNGMPYLAMEFAAGGSLAQRLVNKMLPALQAAELVETLARTVQFVHDRGILHRDLKPANILLQNADLRLQNESQLNTAGQSAVPKLADFGLAKRLDDDQGLTRTQAILGTASYMAPEQAAGNKQAIGPSVDIYGLGAILYELLTGRPPFQAQTRELTIQQVLFDDPQPPSDVRPDVPAELEAICLKCLEKQPGRRYPRALDLAEDLRRYRSGEPISIPSFGIRERDARAAQRLGYEILETLAASPRGIQYKARQIALNRIVVLEVVAAQGKLHPDQVERLRARAAAVAQLHHSNIVELYDLGELNGRPLIVREYVEGRCLAERPAEPPLPAEQTAALVETLARAVHDAHLQGIVHGALSPAEVLVSDDGSCKIIGLGIAAVLRDEQSDQSAKSPTRVHESIDPAADVYALGAILYEMLAGRPPAVGNSFEPPRHWRPDTPRDVEAICLTCLEREPASRYPNAAALAEDLRRYRGREVLFIDDLDAPVQQQRWARRAGYEILEVLGQGPDGFTYKARQVARDRVVVLKRLVAGDRFVPGAKEHFRWEARLVARFCHPNIAQLYDQGEQSDLAYFAREYVDGRMLVEFLADVPFSEDRAWEAAELLESLAEAVATLHVACVVHGGLHPGAVHVTAAGVPKITSFRRAPLPFGDPEDGQLQSEICRRTCYLAPEQLDGNHRRLDRATDVYALGAVLYTMLSGQAPHLGDTLEETLANISDKPPTAPRQWQPTVPEELEVLCLRCLAKQPSERFASAAQLADALGRLLDA
jgi:eukaryotic-like serine/threonine-protein kinase